MKKTSKLKNIIGMLNIPLIIFLLLVGGLLLVANIKSAPFIEAKHKVSNTINDVSENLNQAADSNSSS